MNNYEPMFEYEYKNFENTVEHIKTIFAFGIYEYVFILVWIFAILSSVLYIIPTAKIFFKERKKRKILQNKKELIKQIAMQKDIDDEIEKELNIHN